MKKTKLDRVLELLEQQASQMAVTNPGEEVTVPTSIPDVPSPATTETTTSDVEASLTAPAAEPAGEQVSMDVDPENLPEKSDAAETPAEGESDTFDKDFAELAALVGYDVNSTTKTEPAEQPASPVDEPLSEEENQNFKKLYDQEVERRLAAEGEARNAAAEAKYRKTTLEKEGDKYYSNIDKQKELEAELRIANAAKMPEQIAPLWQSYLLWEETKTPTHKRRAIKDALTLVENMTWVSAEDYYWTILRAENKDIPEVTDKSSITSTASTINGQPKWWWGYLSF